MALTHNTPSATAPTGSLVAPQQRIVQIALTQARPVVERVIETTRMSLQARLDSARTPASTTPCRRPASNWCDWPR